FVIVQSPPQTPAPLKKSVIRPPLAPFPAPMVSGFPTPGVKLNAPCPAGLLPKNCKTPGPPPFWPVTVAVKVTGCPKLDGLGGTAVRIVVVAALFTCCASSPSLGLKLL